MIGGDRGARPGAAELRHFFNTLFPDLGGGFIEFRLLGIFGSKEIHFCSSADDAVRTAHQAGTNPDDENIYFGVCPRSERKGDKSAIRLVHALWSDLDGKDYPGGKPEALDRLRQFRLPPTIIVDSGNGFHAYWRLRTPVTIDSLASIAQVERYLKALAQLLGADPKAAELARILRVPGTLNLKNLPESAPWVTIVECNPTRQWDLSDFGPPEPMPTPNQPSPNPPGWIADSLKELRDGNRNDTFTKVAGRLHQGGWTAAEILTLLTPHAEGAQFPPEELTRLIRGLCERYPTGNPLRAPVTNSGKLEAQSRPLVTLSPSELLSRTRDSITWRVEGVLPCQGVGILAGPAGYGKSWALLDLAIATTLGERWLGHFPTVLGRVLYIDEESSEELLGIRIRKLLAFRAGRPESLDLHFCVGQSVSLSDLAGVARLRALLADLRPQLVVIDSFIRIHRAEENSASDMAAVSAVIRELVRDFDCAFCFADHQRKAGAGETSLDTMLRGSTEKAAFVDSLLSMKKTAVGLIVEHSKSRFAEPVSTFVLQIEDPVPGSTRVLHAGNAEEIKQKAMVAEARPFIEGVLGQEDWVSRQDLLEKAKEAKIREPAISATLKLIVVEGAAEREDRPSKSGRGNKAAHFHLVRGGAGDSACSETGPRGGGEAAQESVFELPTSSSGEPEADSEEPGQ
jgi:hypothetical protein